MKKMSLCFMLIVAMLVTPFSGMSTPVFSAPPLDLDALEKMKEELDKLTDSLENLDPNNPQTPADTVVKDNTIIETNMMIAASNLYTLGLQKNGRVVSSGLSLTGANEVSDWSGIKMIAAGFNHSVGLKSDGTVITAGSNDVGQRDVSNWKDIVAIAAGGSSTIGLKKDGTVIGTGANDHGELDFSTWKNIISIVSGTNHTVGLKSDGTVLAVGKNCGTILNTSSWQGIVSISASSSDILGLDKNGKVYSTYANNVSQFKDCVGIATSEMYAAGLKKDGTVITTADDVNVSTWKNIIAITAGTSHIVGLKSDGTVVSAEMDGAWNLGQTKVSSWNLSTSGDPATSKKSVESVGITVYIDNLKLTLTNQPKIVSGRTLVPMGEFFSALGATIEWIPETKTIKAKRGATNIIIVIGSTKALVNGEEVTINVPAQIFSGRTFVPLAFISQALGDTVEWKGDTKSIYIKRN